MNIDTNKYYNYRQMMMGKTVDHDGAYGCQCWDSYVDYCQYNGFKGANCTTSGYVKDIWENRKTNGMLTHCVETTQLQPGAIVVFKEVSNVTPYSHIAIFDSDVNGSYGRFFGTNQGGKNGAYNITVFPYSAMYETAFLPKALILPDVEEKQNVLNYIPSDFIREKATFYPNCTIKIRKAPSLNGVDTGLYYKQGMHVNYDGYVKRDGYVWISWISASTGERRWMACGELNSKGYNTNPYGVFK